MSIKRVVKEFVYWGIIAAFIWFVSQRLTSIEEIVTVFKEGKLHWLLVALVFQLLQGFFYSIIYQNILRVIGIRHSFRKTVQKYFETSFVDITNPINSTGGFLYFARRLTKGSYHSLLKGTMAVLEGTTIYNLAFTAILLVSLIFLDATDNTLAFIMHNGAAIFVILNFLMALAIIIAIYRPYLFKKWVFKFRGFIFRRKLINRLPMLKLPEDLLEKNLDEFSTSSKAYHNALISQYYALIDGLLSHASQIAVLFFVFLAFGEMVSIPVLLMVYSLSYLFTVLAPTPQGLGIVEGLMQVLMVSLGVQADTSVLVTLVYRGFSIWLPIFIGFLAFKKMGFVDKESAI